MPACRAGRLVPRRQRQRCTSRPRTRWSSASSPGSGDGRFLPAIAVRRDQMASFLVRTAEHLLGRPLPSTPGTFPDDDGNVHEAAIDKVAGAGITAGKSDGSYDPAGLVTPRADGQLPGPHDRRRRPRPPAARPRAAHRCRPGRAAAAGRRRGPDRAQRPGRRHLRRPPGRAAVRAARRRGGRAAAAGRRSPVDGRQEGASAGRPATCRGTRASRTRQLGPAMAPTSSTGSAAPAATAGRLDRLGRRLRRRLDVAGVALGAARRRQRRPPARRPAAGQRGPRAGRRRRRRRRWSWPPSGALSHDPPPSWRAGRRTPRRLPAAATSALGFAGVAAVVGYLEDPGAGNPLVGPPPVDPRPAQPAHGLRRRRPARTASTPAPCGSSATEAPPPSDEVVTWPARGALPVASLIGDTGRWSLSAPASTSARRRSRRRWTAQPVDGRRRAPRRLRRTAARAPSCSRCRARAPTARSR